MIYCYQHNYGPKRVKKNTIMKNKIFSCIFIALVLSLFLQQPAECLRQRAFAQRYPDRFDARGFVKEAVIPDGFGGTTRISLGQPFTRIVEVTGRQRVSTGALLNAVKAGGINVDKTSPIPPAGIPQQPAAAEEPRVLLTSVGGGIYYGLELLSEQLKDNRIASDTLYIPHAKYADQFVSAVRASRVPAPNVIGISAVNSEIETIRALIQTIRREFPDAFIVIGGPETQYTEQLATILDDFDIIIKGQAVDLITDVTRIIGGSGRGDGLNQRQFHLLASFRGGILARSSNALLYNNLAWTNDPDDFHMLKPEDAKMAHIWHTSLGCPKKVPCGFCSMPCGHRYKMVVPRQAHEPGASGFESAQALEEWLAARTDMTPPAEAGEKIYIKITDDDFAANVNRLREFRTRVMAHGWQDMYEFSAIISINSFIRPDGSIDTERMLCLAESGFKDIYVGLDGLCNAVLADKGYTVSQVMAFHCEARKAGLFPTYNIIFTTPYTTREQLVESLLLYNAFPFKYCSQNYYVTGALGTRYANEYVQIMASACKWDKILEHKGAVDLGHYAVSTGWRVPRDEQLYQYALPNNRTFLLIPRTLGALQLMTELIVKKKTPGEVINSSQVKMDEIESVMNKWQSSPDPELRGLYNLAVIYVNTYPGIELVDILQVISRDMTFAGIFSFSEFYKSRTEDKSPTILFLAGLQKIREQLEDAFDAGRYDEAERLWNRLHEQAPQVPNVYQIKARISLAQAKLGDAAEAIFKADDLGLRLELRRGVMSRLGGLYNFREALSENHLALHNWASAENHTRFITLFACHLIDRVKDIAPIDEVDVRLENIVNARVYYNTTDKLTTKMLKDEIASLGQEAIVGLNAGKRLHVYGIPVYIEQKQGKRILVIDIDGIQIPEAIPQPASLQKPANVGIEI